MSDTNKTQYTERLSVHITPAMDDRLEQIANQRNEPKAEIVRAALRAFLDEQEDLISSRRHFSKAFQRRMDYQDWLLIVLLEMVRHSLSPLLTEVMQKPYKSELLLDFALDRARVDQDQLHAKLWETLAEKHEPPA